MSVTVAPGAKPTAAAPLMVVEAPGARAMSRLVPLFDAPETRARLAGALAVAPALGQTPTQKKLETKLTREQQLEQVRQQLEQAKERREALAAEIESLGRDVGSINRALVEAANRGQELEAQVAKAERELSALERTRTLLNKSLAGERQTLAKVLGALQRMGRKPPPALLVHPDDALSSVRGAILMGSVVPP